MKDVFLIADDTFELPDLLLCTDNILKFEKIGESEIVHETIGENRSYFSIVKDNNIFNLMDPDEEERVLSEFETFNIFACSFYKFDYLRILVTSIPSNRKILIDNDHGTIMRKELFLKLESYEDFVRMPNSAL